MAKNNDTPKQDQPKAADPSVPAAAAPEPNAPVTEGGDSQGNEPDPGSQADGTAKLEQDQDQAESTQDAVKEGKDTARENIAKDSSNNPN